MEVGVFTNNVAPNVGGVPVAVEQLRRSLASRGVKPWVVTPEGTEGEGSNVRALPGLRLNGCRMPVPGISRSLQQLGARLDLIHAHHPFGMGSVGASLARMTGRPLVYSLHTRFEFYAHYIGLPAGVVRWWIRRRHARLARATALATAPTESAAAELRAAGFRRVEVLPLPADEEFFDSRPDSSLRELTRREHVAVFAGRLAPEKRPLELLHAVVRALRRHPSWGFAVVGEGPLRARMESAALSSGLNGRIQFLGARSHSEMPRLLAGADLYVSASDSETQGLSMTEAQASGKPVITAEFPGAKELVDHGKTGVVSESPVLSDALSSLLGNERLLRQMGPAARRHALKFHPLRWSKRVVQYYEELVSAQRRHSI